MSQQTIDPIGADRELCVVVVVRVHANAVREGRESRRHFERGTDNRCVAHNVLRAQVVLNEASA